MLQIKQANEIQLQDLPYIEDPFFAKVYVDSGFFDPLNNISAFNYNDGYSTQLKPIENQKQALQRGLAFGELFLLQSNPVSPVVEWVKDESNALGHWKKKANLSIEIEQIIDALILPNSSSAVGRSFLAEQSNEEEINAFVDDSTTSHSISSKQLTLESSSMIQIKSDIERDKQSYKVQSGDTLSSISQKLYGNAYMFTAIAKANGITAPNYIIRAGQELTIPSIDGLGIEGKRQLNQQGRVEISRLGIDAFAKQQIGESVTYNNNLSVSSGQESSFFDVSNLFAPDVKEYYESVGANARSTKSVLNTAVTLKAKIESKPIQDAMKALNPVQRKQWIKAAGFDGLSKVYSDNSASGKVINAPNHLKVHKVSKGLGVFGYAASAAVVAVDTYNAPEGEKLKYGTASFVSEGGAIAAGIAGVKLGAALGAFTGPVAWIGVPVGGFIGGLGGALAYKFSGADDYLKNLTLDIFD